jgi:hypothetical protein
MPPLSLPMGVPGGLYWFIVWVSINGIILVVLNYLRDTSGNLMRQMKKAVGKKIPSLNEYLIRLVMKSNNTDPYDGPVISADDLAKLMARVRDTARALSKYDRMQRHIGFGTVAACCAITGAIITGALYYFNFPTRQYAASLAIILGVSLSCWSLYHVLNSIIHHFYVIKDSNEEE